MLQSKIIEPELMKKVEKLSIASKKLFSGATKGKRRSIKRGSSVEFADYRDYHAGDDFRFIDWNIYARLDKLFLKTFVEEENVYIHILMDLSASMSFGMPSKLEYGKKICAVLAYIGLLDLDMVAMATFSEDLVGQILPTRGKDKILVFLDFLEKAQVSQKTNMSYCFKKYAFNAGHPGVMIIVSDFLVPTSDYVEGLKTLIYRNYDVNVIHLLSQEEIDPRFFGELKLQDSETGEIKEVSITYGALEKYKDRLKKFCYELDSFCTKKNVTYLKINTNVPFEELILRILRREQIVV